MAEGIRTYDSNIRRKTNKQYHQLEKNMMEKNYFSYVGIVINNDFYGDGIWCKVKLVPTINFKEFVKNVPRNSSSYKNREQDRVEELETVAFRSQTIDINNNDVVLIIFTDVNTRQVLKDLIGNKSKTSKFIENNQEKHSIDFGIIINKLL